MDSYTVVFFRSETRSHHAASVFDELLNAIEVGMDYAFISEDSGAKSIIRMSEVEAFFLITEEEVSIDAKRDEAIIETRRSATLKPWEL